MLLVEPSSGDSDGQIVEDGEEPGTSKDRDEDEEEGAVGYRANGEPEELTADVSDFCPANLLLSEISGLWSHLSFQENITYFCDASVDYCLKMHFAYG